MAEIVRIESFKYPDVVRYFFPAILVKDEPDQTWIYSPVGAPVFSGKNNKLSYHKYHDLSILFPDRDYNVIIFWNENWELRFYYVNMALPVQHDGDLYSYIDLDLDVVWYTPESVLVQSGQRAEGVYIDDREEYEERKVAYNYPLEIMERAEASLLEVLDLIDKREFPFDGSLLSWRPSETVETLANMLDENGLWQRTKKGSGNMQEEENLKDKQTDEYNLMMLLERLETLREDLDEAGFSSLQEIEAALSITANGTNGSNAVNPELEARRTHLMEIRDELLDLDIDSYSEINDQIRTINSQLDDDEE